MLKKLYELPVRPMTIEESHLLVMILSSDRDEVELTENDFRGFLPAVFAKRLAYHQVKVSAGLFYFITSLLRTPAHATVWVWTLANMRKDPTGIITISQWVNTFAEGVPTEQSYDTAWDSQKDPRGGNLLDQPKTWEGI